MCHAGPGTDIRPGAHTVADQCGRSLCASVVDRARLGIHTAYEHISVDCLEHSGEDVGGEPCMEIYLNDPTNTAPDAVQALVSVPRE